LCSWNCRWHFQCKLYCQICGCLDLFFPGFTNVHVHKSMLNHYTVNHKKTCHFVSDYNSGVTCSIFIIFLLVQRGRNTLQFTYLMAWWRHNSVTISITKVYFIQLVLKIKYVEFEDNPKFFLQNLRMWMFSARRLIIELPTKKWKIRSLDDFLQKLHTTGSIEHTVVMVIDFKMCCLYVVLDLLGSVETQLGWSGKFY